MSITIATLRHGTTEFNRLHKIAGTIDCDLDENGVGESKRISNFIMSQKFDAVIASPLRRSWKTACITSGLKKSQIDIVGGCTERNCGLMQGISASEVKKIRPKILYVRVGNYTYSLNPPMGESFFEVRERAKRFSNYLFTKYKNRKVLVVSSQSFLQQLHGIFNNQDCYECLKQDILALELNVFSFDDNNKLVKKSRKRLSRKVYKSW